MPDKVTLLEKVDSTGTDTIGAVSNPLPKPVLVGNGRSAGVPVHEPMKDGIEVLPTAPLTGHVTHLGRAHLAGHFGATTMTKNLLAQGIRCLPGMRQVPTIQRSIRLLSAISTPRFRSTT